MKLLTKTTLFLSASLVLIIGIWAVLFYVSMLDEIYDSIDDGLDNYKLLIIDKLKSDPAVLRKTDFNESNYAIKKISNQTAMMSNDRYSDTLMFMRNEMEYEPVRMLHTDFKYNEQHYQLQVISSMVEEDDLIADLLYFLVVLYILIVVSVILLNNVLLRTIWKPFYTLLAQLKRFHLRTANEIILPKTSITEFKHLNQTVQELIRKNVEVYESQKQFIGNASHELQTPVAICISRIELLLEEEKLEEGTAKTLASVLETLTRLTRLNKALLLLSKIENKQFLDVKPINVNQVISSQLEELRELIEFQHLNVNVKDKGEVVITMNPELCAILFANILRNALVHNFENGTIDIVICENKVQVINTSDAPELDATKIFTRFYTQSARRNSTGLGLAIANSICSMSGIAITYDFKSGKHTFIIKC